MKAYTGEVMRNGLFYAGIDEAGLGPRLGPLCTALSLFEVDGWHNGAPAPDLWKRLRRVVCREPRGARRGRIPINDSKRLKAPGLTAESDSGNDRHPLALLERGVLAFGAQCWGRGAADDATLLQCLGVCLTPDLAWYDAEPVPLPLSTTSEHAHLMAAEVREACGAAGVRPAALSCSIMSERDFSAEIERLGSKSAAAFSLVAAMLRRVWEQADASDGEGGGPRVVVDRQGGRIAYAHPLARALPGTSIRVMEETPLQSRYEVVEEGREGRAVQRRMTVIFRVEAESAHFPVALASMTAKMVRELLMRRFNGYWCSRVKGLRPTAGYAQDAGRWLRDVREVVPCEQLHVLVRRA